MKDKFGKNWAKYAIAMCVAVAFYFVLKNLGDIWGYVKGLTTILSPIFIGAFLAYLLNPIVNIWEKKVFKKIKKKKVRHNISIITTLICTMAIVTGLLLLLIPALISNITGIINNGDFYIKSALAYVDDINQYASQYRIDLTDMKESAITTVTKIASDLTNNMTSVLNMLRNLGGTVLNLVLGVILAVYFLIEKYEIQAGVIKFFRAALPGTTYKENADFLRRSHSILIKFLGMDIIDALIVGLVNSLFMLILGMPHIALISLMVGLTNLLPTFGPMIGGAFGSILLLLAAPEKVIPFLILTLCLQTIDGYILKPKMFGDSMGVSPVGILVCVIVGGKLFGLTGMFLAIPFAAIWSIFYTENVLPRLRKNRDYWSGTQPK